MKSRKMRLTMWAMFALFALLACNLTISTSGDGGQPATDTAAPVLPSPTPALATETAAPPTGTAPPQASPTNPPAAATPTQTPTDTGPQCIVQQDLFFRSGPGTAYDPPLYALEPQTVLIPLGFNPVGVPGGPWVQVNDTAHNQIGWVSAGSQFVSCNVDLATLPAVAVEPPPKPPPPRTGNSAPDGDFPDNLVLREDFNQNYLLRLYAHDINVGEEDGDGITAVIYSITDENGNEVHANSEETAGFCVFGGGEPECNPWLFEDAVYKWYSTGIPVENGTYELEVRVVLDDGQEGNWRYQISVELN